jgi:GNAT superfamily N-acetyltransferase
VQVRTVTAGELEALLPLIADYQRFYAGTARDDAHNAAFFGQFVAPSERGTIIAAYEPGGATAPPAGYACLYWTYSSVSATEVVLMNDLFVRPARRGGGVGELLIGATVRIARERGAASVRWFTGLDNRRAQRLYERVGAQRTAFFEYEIAVDPG